MAVDTLVLAANPGSASRKYALYQGGKFLASLHFEHEDGQIVCTLMTPQKTERIDSPTNHLETAPEYLLATFKQAGIKVNTGFNCIGLRVVAPTAQFLHDHLLDNTAINKLKTLQRYVPLHIHATLQEAEVLKRCFTTIPIVAISDSAFHITKPDYAWNYAIPLDDADRLDIKRFGYHGISLAANVRILTEAKKLPAKLVVCHLGSGASVTAVLNGQSVDNTMGFSPLEGLMMATRSGSVDLLAINALQKELKLTMKDIDDYLNKRSGLLGVSGLTSDIRELLEAEAGGHYRAGLALRMYVHRVQQAIGQMVAALGGIDALVFTGTVGCRSFPVRQRIVDGLDYLGLAVDLAKNERAIEPTSLQNISPKSRHKPVFVITTDENYEIATRAASFIKT